MSARRTRSISGRTTVRRSIWEQKYNVETSLCRIHVGPTLKAHSLGPCWPDSSHGHPLGPLTSPTVARYTSGGPKRSTSGWSTARKSTSEQIHSVETNSNYIYRCLNTARSMDRPRSNLLSDDGPIHGQTTSRPTARLTAARPTSNPWLDYSDESTAGPTARPWRSDPCRAELRKYSCFLFFKGFQ